jgi:hypothetical protein
MQYNGCLYKDMSYAGSVNVNVELEVIAESNVLRPTFSVQGSYR